MRCNENSRTFARLVARHANAGRDRKTGLRVDDSVANFVLIHFPPDGEKTAAKADVFLSQNGIILRGVASYGLPNCLRMTVGTEEQNKLAVSLIQKFMAA